jgi:hypothetical protein
VFYSEFYKNDNPIGNGIRRLKHWRRSGKKGIPKTIFLGFSNRVCRTRFRPQRLGRFAPLTFSAYGGKIQATRYAGDRWLTENQAERD